MGAWRFDLPAGLGCYSCLAGALHEGEWVEGLKDGWGVATTASGQVTCGMFPCSACTKRERWVYQGPKGQPALLRAVHKRALKEGWGVPSPAIHAASVIAAALRGNGRLAATCGARLTQTVGRPGAT